MGINLPYFCWRKGKDESTGSRFGGDCPKSAAERCAESLCNGPFDEDIDVCVRSEDGSVLVYSCSVEWECNVSAYLLRPEST